MSEKNPTKKPGVKPGHHPNSRANLKPPWREGDPGGPGRKPLTEAEKEARETLRYKFAEMFLYLEDLPDADIKRVMKSDPKAAWMGRAILKGRRSGDLTELHKIADRLLGKSRASIEHHQPLSPQEQEMLERMTDEQLLRVANGADISEVFKESN